MSIIQSAARRSLILLIAGLAAACGGGGGGGDSGPPPVAPSKLFVGDSGNAAIGSSPNSNPSAGVGVVDRIITGSNTMLSQSLSDFAIDVANDRLYVSDLRRILVFNNVSTATGNIAPSRIVSTIAGDFGSFVSLHLDTANDRLYAATNGTAGLGSHDIRVFDNASTATNAAASRTFSFGTNFLIDIVVDTTRDLLYVYNRGGTGTEIAVFTGASALNGTVTPARTINIGDSFSSGVPVGMFIDAANDRLYAPRGTGQVLVFDTASTKNGNVTTTAAPSRVINLPVPFAETTITVDLAANRLYAADTGGLNIIDNASTVSGTPPATKRVLAPGGGVFKAVAVKP